MNEDKLVRTEEVPAKEIPAQTLYVFEQEIYQIRYLHGGNVLHDGSSWTGEKYARESAEKLMKVYQITPESTLVMEIVKTVSEYKAKKTGRTNYRGDPEYENTGYYKGISEEVIWTSKEKGGVTNQCP